MDLTRYQLRMRPFPTTPDVQFYYPASSHETVLNALACAIDDQAGLMLLTGAPGTGKTLLAHMLLQRLGPQFNTSLITNCRFGSAADLHRAVLFDLGQPYQKLGEEELRIALSDFVLNQFAEGRPTVLVFDEAQDLSAWLLEELRLLSNLEVGRGKTVQLVLLALPSILETLNHPGLAALNQRLAQRLTLDPLDMHESADYLLHQIRTAGGRGEQTYSDEAVSVLGKNARGIPRLLNRYALQALNLAAQINAEMVDVEVALEALASLGIDAEVAEEEFPTRPTLASDLAESIEEEREEQPKQARPAYTPMEIARADSPHETGASTGVFAHRSPVRVVHDEA